MMGYEPQMSSLPVAEISGMGVLQGVRQGRPDRLLDRSRGDMMSA